MKPNKYGSPYLPANKPRPVERGTGVYIDHTGITWVIDELSPNPAPPPIKKPDLTPHHHQIAEVAQELLEDRQRRYQEDVRLMRRWRECREVANTYGGGW